MTAPADPDEQILAALLASGDDYLSGELLAAQLGISRVSVWNRMKKLEDTGFRFRAVRNRGYQLQSEPEALHPALLRTYARRMHLGLPLHAYTSIDSTNSEVERLLLKGEPTPFAVLASEQTRGRGRLGRTWSSPDCGNLYVSLALRPAIPRERMQIFTLWMGVNIARLLAAISGLPLKVKWPNDLLCRGRKLAGMLTEARVDNDRFKELVLGVGFNINAQSPHFPPAIRAKATSLRLEAGRQFPLHRLAIQILQGIQQASERIEKEDISTLLLKQWQDLDCLRGKHIAITSGNQRLDGIAVGIDSEGSLLVRDPEGREHRVRAGDVSLESNYAE